MTCYQKTAITFWDELCERLGVPKLPGWVNRFAHAGDAAMEVAGNTAVRFRQAKTEIVTASKVAYRFLVGVTNNATASPESAGNSNRGAPRFQAAWFKNLITTGAKPSSSSDLETKEEDALRQHQQPDAEPQQQHNNGDVSLVKSQPLVKVLQLIHAQEHGSLFERRFPAQESDKYKSIVQQHVNLETIQTKLRKDAYSSCSLSFYRDMLLLFNKAVVFFPKSSPGSRTAHQLRRLVLNKMKKKNPNHDPSSEPSDSVVPAPIIVCRKRSSISSKPSAAASSFGQNLKGDEKEKAAAPAKPKVAANEQVLRL
ncbi:hypothetical protein ACFX13_042432 [Malus domestica]